nr:hypothetical protein [Tanacetum cinerariifolium]
MTTQEKEERLAFLDIKRRDVECREREIEQQDMRFYLQPYDYLTEDQRKAMDEIRAKIKAKDRIGDRSDDEDRYRRRRDADRYKSERGGQDRRISNRSNEEDKDGRMDRYRNMDRDWRTDDRRRDISRDDSMRDRSRSRSVKSDEEGANEKRRDKNKDKGTNGEDDMRCGIRHLRYRKTWYGVLRDSVVAFEVVVRFYRYGGEINLI